MNIYNEWYSWANKNGYMPLTQGTLISKMMKEFCEHLESIPMQAGVIVNFAEVIEQKLKAVTQKADIGLYNQDAGIYGLIADQRVIPYKDALKICLEIASKISK